MKREDHQLIQQVLDGAVTPAAFDEFQQRLRNEPELARSYGEYALLHHSLHEEYEGLPVGSSPVLTTSRRRGPVICGFLVIAALVVVVAVFQCWKSADAFTGVASVKFSPDAVWRTEGHTQPHGELLDLAGNTTIHLAFGAAEVTVGGAATVVEGPAKLTVFSKDVLYLAEGRARVHLGGHPAKVRISTPMIVVDSGGDFAVGNHPDSSVEVHALAGDVKLTITKKSETLVLVPGEAVYVSKSDGNTRFQADGGRFRKKLGSILTLEEGPFKRSEWLSEFGNPSISENRIDGVNYTLFHKLPVAAPDETNPILLATVELDFPTNGEFHTDGWAGMSFYRNHEEIVFFGDSYGMDRTWSLDIKQHLPVVLPQKFLTGPRTVTLRYDRKSGSVSLHEGGLPLNPAFCAGFIPAGLSFDEIRIGSSANAGLSVRSLAIRTVGN